MENFFVCKEAIIAEEMVENISAHFITFLLLFNTTGLASICAHRLSPLPRFMRRRVGLISLLAELS
jgi:hypothetical protein